ncbi:MAG TPA: winged helix-turn-helix domain-containing protein [Xanthobacteraceae bacterium]
MANLIAKRADARGLTRTTASQAAGASVAPPPAQAGNGGLVLVMGGGGEGAEKFRFADFLCLPSRRQLLNGGNPVPIGSRAFDILVALLNGRGNLVSKDDLIAAAWPDTNVGETNLRVHMAALRKALHAHGADENLICTVPGRGYRLAVPVAREESWPTAAASGACLATGLPVASTRMFGRADFIRALAVELPLRRFITIVGPGGIGKTTVAVAAAHAVAGSYADGVHFVDLAPVADPAQLPALLARALAIAANGAQALSELSRRLVGKRMLVVMDNCEHLVDAMATLIEPLSRTASRIDFLATSREPLRIAGEWVRRLPPLQCPREPLSISAAEALAYPSIQLFVDRICASDATYELSDASAPTVAEICRRLDGIPLAIELAAGRVEAFGIEGLAVQLDTPLRLLSGGRRTAHARHQTLSGMLDWSYGGLSEPEQAVFRRLAIFPDEFTLPAASAVAGSGDDDFNLLEHVATLVAKSLVIADLSKATARYRLLATTRAYALEKLSASGDLDAVTRRYAGEALAADPL